MSYQLRPILYPIIIFFFSDKLNKYHFLRWFLFLMIGFANTRAALFVKVVRTLVTLSAY